MSHEVGYPFLRGTPIIILKIFTGGPALTAGINEAVVVHISIDIQGIDRLGIQGIQGKSTEVARTPTVWTIHQ